MKNVSKKLLAAIASLGGTVDKSGYNSYSKYKYVTEADINKAVLPALLKQGLLLTTSVETVSEEPSTADQKNRFANVVLLHKIIDTESGEVLEFKSTGTGADTLDKSVYKAYTGACKYFLMKTFMLSGDDDPENDGGSAPEKKAPPQEKERPLKPGEKRPGHFEKKAEEKKKEEPKKEETKPVSKDKPNFSKFSNATKKEAPSEPKEPEEEKDENEDPGY